MHIITLPYVDPNSHEALYGRRGHTARRNAWRWS